MSLGVAMNAGLAAGAEVVFLCDTTGGEHDTILSEDAALMLALWCAAGWRYEINLDRSWLDLQFFTRET